MKHTVLSVILTFAILPFLMADSDFSSSSLSTLYIYGNDGKAKATFTKSKPSGILDETGLTGTVSSGGDHWIVNITGGMLYGCISAGCGVEVNIAGTQVGISNSASGKTAIRGSGGVRICGPGMLHIDQYANQPAIDGGSGNVALTLGAVVGINCFQNAEALTGNGVRILASFLHIGACTGIGIYCKDGDLSIDESIVSVVSAKAAVYIRSKGAFTSTMSSVHLASMTESAVQCGTDVIGGCTSISVVNSVFCALGWKHGIQCRMVGTPMPVSFNNVVGVIAGNDCGVYNSASIDVSGGSTKLSIVGNMNGDHSGEISGVDVLAGDTSSGQAIQMYSPRKTLFYQEAGSVKLFSPGTVALVSATNIVTGGSLTIDHKPSYGDLQTLFTWQGAISAAEIVVGRNIFQSDVIYSDFDIAQSFSAILPSSAVLFATDSAKSSTGIRSDVTYVTGGSVSVKASGTGILVGGRNSDFGFLRVTGGKVSVDSDMVGVADRNAAGGDAPSTQDSEYYIELNGGLLSARGKLDGILTCGGIWMNGGTLEAAATGGYAAGTISADPGLRGYALSANNGLYINGGSFLATSGTLRTTPCTYSDHGFAAVHPCDLAVSGASSASTVTITDMVPSWYGVNDLYPVNGKLRFWLPLGAASLKWNGTSYKAGDSGNVIAGNNVFKVAGTTGGGTLPPGVHTETVNGIQWTFTIKDGEAWLGEDPASKDWDWSRIATAIPENTVGDIVVPSTLGGCAVKGVIQGAFAFCSKITSIEFSNGLTHIDLDTFYGCSNLVSVTVPASIEWFHEQAFLGGCPNLLYINVAGESEYYKSIDGVLLNSSATSLHIVPEGRKGAFEIPNGVEDVTDSFVGCSKITSVLIPSSVDHISNDSFFGCSSLERFIVDEGNLHFKAIEGCLYYIGDNGILSLGVIPEGFPYESHEIPSNVSTIYGGAVWACPRLVSLVIPKSVTRIGDDFPEMGYKFGAFGYCTNLVSFLVDSENPAYKSVDGCILSRDGIVFVAFPGGRGGAYTVPSGAQRIFAYAFAGCSRLKSIVIPESVTEIDERTFMGCDNLAKLYLPKRFEGRTDNMAIPEGCTVVFYSEDSNPTSVFRFYSKAYKGHFFTIDEEEKDNLIANNPNWKYEGPAYRAFKEAALGTVALYRFYSKGYRGHFFTINADEAESVKQNRNWKYEGIAYYVYPEEIEGSVPVFRFWSKRYRHHFYTTDVAEKDNLIATNPNWKYEGIAFYALPADDNGRSANGAVRAAAAAGKAAEAEVEGMEGEGTGETGGTGEAGGYGKAAEAATSGTSGQAGGGACEAAAPWTLTLRRPCPGRILAVPDVADLGEVTVETSDGMATCLAILATAANTDADGADDAELRLTLPDGVFTAQLWDGAGTLLEEREAEGAFDFALAASGVWRWLRILDPDGEEVFSIWIKAEDSL